jgi:hypothetical protein
MDDEDVAMLSRAMQLIESYHPAAVKRVQHNITHIVSSPIETHSADDFRMVYIHYKWFSGEPIIPIGIALLHKATAAGIMRRLRGRPGFNEDAAHIRAATLAGAEVHRFLLFLARAGTVSSQYADQLSGWIDDFVSAAQKPKDVLRREALLAALAEVRNRSNAP